MEPEMIEDWIPHRGPACMIDRLLEADDEHAVVEADVPLAGRHVRDQAMPAWAGIELMAQAVAAWAGARARAAGRPVAVGYLLGTRRYEAFCDGFPSGSTLRITACRDLVADTGIGMFNCSVHLGETLAAQAQIAVFEPKAPVAGEAQHA
jgi:predicted hotdog family 3-hydroxylacyl-ACP dehydratase